MTNYTRIELEEIAETLITNYMSKYNGNIFCIDIEGFIQEALSLPIEYVKLAEKDYDKLGCISDGRTPLTITDKGKTVKKVYPTNTIIIEQYLLNINESGRRRFTLAHEAGHFILNKIHAKETVSSFHREYDNERNYEKADYHDRFNLEEVQANAIAASLLMPHFLVQKAIDQYAAGKRLPIYGNNILKHREKVIIRKMADSLGVSFSALVIRLRKLKYFNEHELDDFLLQEFNLGGGR